MLFVRIPGLALMLLSTVAGLILLGTHIAPTIRQAD
jgi:hypothetical protein